MHFTPVREYMVGYSKHLFTCLARPTAADVDGARIAHLRVVARLYQPFRDCSAELEPLPLLMLLRHLAEPSPLLQSAAASLLTGVAEGSGRSVADMLGSSPLALQYVGRNVVDQPSLLREVARLMGVEEPVLTGKVVPHAIGWLCLHVSSGEGWGRK